MVSKRPMFIKMKGEATRVIQKSEMSEVNWLDTRSALRAGGLGGIGVAQNLLSDLKVLAPKLVRSKETGIHTRQAYWSLQNQKANEQANRKDNYDLNMGSD